MARSLAELSRKTGSDEAAASYQRIADLVGPDDELDASAQYLLTVDTTDSDKWQCERAGETLLEASVVLRRTRSPTERCAYADRARALGGQARNGPLQVRAYNFEASLEMDTLGERERAREHLVIARRMAEDIPYQLGEAWALARMGELELLDFIHSDMKGYNPDRQAAIEASDTASRSALTRFETLGAVEGQVKAHKQLAMTAIIARDFDSAVVEYRTALQLARLGGDDYDIALVLLELGRASVYSNLTEDAIRQYREALRYKRRSASWWHLGDLFLLVQVGSMLGDERGVHEHLSEMMQVATAQGDPASLKRVHEATEMFGSPGAQGR